MKKSIGSKRAVVGLCAVLIAVSSFLYAPMEVDASENIFAFSGSSTLGSQSLSLVNFTSDNYNFVDNPMVGSDYAHVFLDFNAVFNLDKPVNIRNFILYYNSKPIFAKLTPTSSDSNLLEHIFTSSVDFFVPVSALYDKNFLFNLYFVSSSVGQVNYDFVFDYDLKNIVYLTGEESASYQQGYNLGYSAGQQAGEDIGYSNGYEVGFEQGVNLGYESGFEAGKDSVDTQSYYDLGYSAGYDEGYLAGYDEGYEQGHDDGYAQAVANLTKYGADATTYPVHLGTVSDTNTHTTLEPIYNAPADMTWIPYEFDISSYKIDPQYNYRILGLLDEFCFGGQFYQYSKASIFLQVGGKDYYIGSWSGGYDTKFSPGFQIYVPGSEMGTKLAIKVVAYNCAGTTEKQQYSYPYINLISSKCTMTVSNMGPASAEANQIANQTDVLNNALEEQTEVLEEQVETQKGIAKSLKDFFGSFFDNFVDSVIGIFVPSTEEMESLFNRLNDFFAETFGFLYYPFDFIIDAFNIFLQADSGTGLTLPSFSIMGYEVWGNQTYDLSSEPLVGEIFGYVRIGTGALLAMWFVNYLRDFFDKRFGGGGN